MESYTSIWEIKTSRSFFDKLLLCIIIFINDDFTDDLFVLKQHFSNTNTNFIFLRRHSQIQNLVQWILVFCNYFPCFSKFKFVFIVDTDVHAVSH